MKNKIEKQSLGIYVHIPFCKKKCSYCDFYSVVTEDKNIQKDYIMALIKQIKTYAKISKTYLIDSIYIGGGTPSCIDENLIYQVIRCVFKNFNVGANAEITIEANPESITDKFLKKMKLSGVNRLSIGIQSSNVGDLATLGRIHSFEQAKNAVELANKYKFTNISVDLMYGLEGQDLDGIIDCLNKILALETSHISAYALKLEEGTPLYFRNPVLPDDDMQADMYLCISQTLEERGFDHYEISNFCRPGFKSKHNSKYWDLSEYLGFGASSHSFLGGKRFYFVSNIYEYIEGINRDRSVAFFEDECTFKDRSNEYIMLKLRTCEGIDTNEFWRKFHIKFDRFAERLEKLERHGLCVKKDGAWALTKRGFLVSNSIILDILKGDQYDK